MAESPIHAILSQELGVCLVGPLGDIGSQLQHLGNLGYCLAFIPQSIQAVAKASNIQYVL